MSNFFSPGTKTPLLAESEELLSLRETLTSNLKKTVEGFISARKFLKSATEITVLLNATTSTFSELLDRSIRSKDDQITMIERILSRLDGEIEAISSSLDSQIAKHSMLVLCSDILRTLQGKPDDGCYSEKHSTRYTPPTVPGARSFTG